MSDFFRTFAVAKNKKQPFKTPEPKGKTADKMTKNEQFYAEQVICYLNLLHGDDVFSYEENEAYSGANGHELNITCKNTAYRNELYQLVHILDAMTPLIETREMHVTIR